MTFFKRLTYYLFGFTIGLLFLLIVFGGKKTQCNYSPSSRVKNDILEKDWVFQNNIKIPSDTINWFKKSKVIFRKSIINADSCDVYNFSYNSYFYFVKNCDNKAFFIK